MHRTAHAARAAVRASEHLGQQLIKIALCRKVMRMRAVIAKKTIGGTQCRGHARRPPRPTSHRTRVQRLHPPPGISRRHAEIRPSRGRWTIEDLGSTNGVLVNGTEIRGVRPLAPGDRLELGSTAIVFELG